MANPIIVPFKAEHLLLFRGRDGDRLETVSTAYLKEKHSIAFTAIDGESIVGCAGVTVMWPGVGQVWTVLTPEILKYPIWLTRTIRLNLNTIMRACNLHRVEAIVYADEPRNNLWIRALGFNLESEVLVRKFTHDKRDVYRYEIVR